MYPTSPAEHSEIAGYLFQNYRHLLNPVERAIYEIEILEGRHYTNVQAKQLLQDGLAGYYESVMRRLIREHGADLRFNRCPRCQQLCRTPLARQCHNIKCLHDWHGG
ncbi:MAG: hypothetical protein OEZ39_04250 [Gammaproteobacteria bacterium]|nr:hypothetical protein [Gammaproteobacteria bacterium]MDH5651070.1 hypothetical protein [Gammaproteobacteria bacterium]